jgi:PST family polysaccharide transporter
MSLMDFSQLKRKSVHGGLVNVGAQAFTVSIQLISTVILARLLTPEDYGTLAMVTAVTAFASLFRDFGLSSAAIHKKGLTTAQQSNLFWLNVLTGGFLTLVVATSAPLVAIFYDKPELVDVTLVLSLSFIITSLGTQHGAMLVRKMQFVRSSGARVVGAFATLAISVVLALNGFSYWALVWGNVTGATVTTTLLLFLSPFRPKLPSRKSGVRELIGFGAHVTGFSFVNYFSRNLDNILIGRFVGADVLGHYSRAYQLLMFPIVNLRGPIESVAFPAMSQLDHKSQEFRFYYSKMVTLLALGTMPLMVWLYVSAAEVIYLVLGPNWGEVVPIFSVLAIVGFVQPVASTRGLIMLSSGQSRRYLYAGIMTAIIVSFAFCVGIFWGVLGLIWAYVIAEWVLFIPMHAYSLRGTSIHLSDLFLACAIPCVFSLMSGFVVILFSDQFGQIAYLYSVAIKGSIVFLGTLMPFFLSSSNRRLIITVFRQDS